MPDMSDLYSRMGNIEGKVDILLQRSTTAEKRLGVLEKFEARTAGIAVAVSVVVGFAIKLL